MSSEYEVQVTDEFEVEVTVSEEPPRQVLDQGQVQLDQGGPDPGALGVAGRQHREPFEQLPGLRPVG